MESETAQPAASSRWHLEKGIPVALIALLLGQSALGVWYARGRVAIDDDHERRLSVLEKEREVARMSERMAVIESAITDIRRSNERTESLLREAFAKERR